MSYSQIFRRVHRILKSAINDAIDSLTPEERELADFDDALGGNAKNTGGASQAGGTHQHRQGAGAHAGSQQHRQGAGAQAGSRQQAGSGPRGGESRGGSGQAASGKRKPGERDDAYYFAVLGLSPSATVEDVKRAYKMLMRRFHPDRVATLSAAEQKAATEKAQNITEAYHIISRRRGFS